MSVTLGSKVKDTLTGFTGIAVLRTEFLYGCVHIGVEPQTLSDKGEPLQIQFFDEQRVEILDKIEGKPQPSPDSSAISGSIDTDIPTRSGAVTREIAA